jgi:hypothetical protein
MKLGVILILIAAPAMADDIVGQPLEGPFATRDEACKAVLATRGPCTTYQTQITPSATRGWTKVELGSINDEHPRLKTKHFGLFVEINKQWFGRFLGTNGLVDTEFFPRCPPGGGVGSCAPNHADKPSYYSLPKLSWVNAVAGGSKELVLFYPTPSDVGFRELAPTAELVQVCGLGAGGVPSCTADLFAVTRSRVRVKVPADLFPGDGSLAIAGEVKLADGSYETLVGQLKF